MPSRARSCSCSDNLKIVAPFEISGPHEIDEASLDPGDCGHDRLARTNLAGIALAFERGRAFERLFDRIDLERQRADRRPVQARKVVRQTLVLAVDDQIDIALRVEVDILRAMSAGAAEAQAFDRLASAPSRGTRSPRTPRIRRPRLQAEAAGARCRRAAPARALPQALLRPRAAIVCRPQPSLSRRRRGTDR